MQPESIIAVLLPLSAATILICSLIFRYRRRELKHKEWLVAIEKGIPPPEIGDLGLQSEGSPRLYLLRGLLWLFGGVGIFGFLLGLSLMTAGTKTAMQRAVQTQRLKNMGASDELIRQVQSDTTPENSVPRGFFLVALAPIGVGLAYLIFYRSEKNVKGKQTL
jgi:hypothetical protein